MKTGKDIWDAIKDRFQDFEDEPPEMGWENINSRINKGKGETNNHYKVAGLTIALILITVSVLFTFDFSSSADKRSYSQQKDIPIIKEVPDSGEASLPYYQPGTNSSPSSSSITGSKGSGRRTLEDKKESYNETNDSKYIATGEETIVLSESKKEGGFEQSKSDNREDKSSFLNKEPHLVQEKGEEKKTGSTIKGTALIQTNTETKQAPTQLPKHSELLTVVPNKPIILLNVPMEGDFLPPVVIAKNKGREENKVMEEPKNEKEKEADNPVKKYYFQVFFSPRYSYRRIASNAKDDMLIVDIKNGLNFRQRFGYETGVFFSRDLNSRLSINAGLSLVSLNESITYSYTKGAVNTIRFETEKNGQYTVVPIYENDTATASSSYYYSGVTLSSSYSFLQTKSRRFYLIFGTGVNLLIKGKTVVELNGVENSTLYFPSRENPLEQMNFKLNLGGGYGHRLGEKIELNVEPAINYYLGSTFKEREPVGIKPYTLGVNIGLRF